MTYIVLGIIILVALFLVAGGSLGRGVRVGPVVEDLEARLKPILDEGPTWMASGKVHRERYADGREAFDLRCAGIRTNTGEPSVPVDAGLDVFVGEQLVATVRLRGGHARLELRSADGETIPDAAVGTPVSIRYQGHVLLSGIFEED
jgi:hypothetical protein